MSEQPSSSVENVEGARLMRIKVKTMEPATYDLEVPHNLTIGALKSEHLCQRVNTPPERQRIIYRGRALRDEQSLESAGVGEDDTIHLVLRPADSPQGPDIPAASTPDNAAPVQGMEGMAALLGSLPGGVGNMLQGLLAAGGAQAGAIQINGGIPIPINLAAQGGFPGLNQAMHQGARGPFPPAPSAPGQQQQQAAGGVRPSTQAPPHLAAGQVPASPAWLDTPHLVSSLAGYLEALQSPSFVHQPMPLTWGHVLTPAEQSRALSGLTNGLREVLRGSYLPADLRSLMQASETDREGRGAADAGVGTPGGAATMHAAQVAAGMPPLVTVMNGMARLGRPPQPLLDPNYRYLPLAVAALAELTRRADTHLSTSMTPQLRELSGALMASASGNPRSNRALEQQVMTLGQQLSSAMALLTELARLATGVSSALQGDIAPLVFSRPTVLQPNGSGPTMPILQPRQPHPAMLPGFMQQAVQSAAPGQQQGSQGSAAPGTGGISGQPAASMHDMIMQQVAQQMQAQVNSGQNTGFMGQVNQPREGASGVQGGMLPGLGVAGSIQINIVDDQADPGVLGPLLNMMGGGGAGNMGSVELGAGGGLRMMSGVDLMAMLQQGSMQGHGQAPQQQQQGSGVAGASAAAAAGAPPPSGTTSESSISMQEYMHMMEPVMRAMSSNVASNVAQRLGPLLPLMQSPEQTVQLVSALVTEVLNENLSRTIQTMMANEHQISQLAQSVQSSNLSLPETVERLQQMAAAYSSSQAAAGGAQSQPLSQQQQPAPAANAVADSRQAMADEGATMTTAAGTVNTLTVVADQPSSSTTAAASLKPEVHAPSPSAAETAETGEEPSATTAAAAAPSATTGPRGLGLGLKPVLKKKQAASLAAAGEVQHTPSQAAGGSAVEGPEAAALQVAPSAAPSSDMSGLMAMMGQMMAGGAGGPGAGLTGAAAAAAGSSGGGLGGLMQMASSIASDPAMQPMLQSAMSSLLGGGAGRGNGGSGSGGLGDLLGSLMSGLPPPGSRMGAGAGAAAAGPTVEEVLGYEVLDNELGTEEASAWRSLIEADEVKQQHQNQGSQSVASLEERKDDSSAGFSEVYRAGLPPASITAASFPGKLSKNE